MTRIEAIRQRDRTTYNRAFTLDDSVEAMADRTALLEAWDTRETALRALVKQLRRDAKIAKRSIEIQPEAMKRQELSGLWLGLERASEALSRLLEQEP